MTETIKEVVAMKVENAADMNSTYCTAYNLLEKVEKEHREDYDEMMKNFCVYSLFSDDQKKAYRICIYRGWYSIIQFSFVTKRIFLV